MNYIRHLIKSKGTNRLLSRALMIYNRFGITDQKSNKALNQIVEIGTRYNCVPTLFITANLLDCHDRLLDNLLSQRDVTVGLHGNHHIDHAIMSAEDQMMELTCGLEKFKKRKVSINGFRGPFLRFNKDTSAAVTASGMQWVSHSVMLIAHNSNGFGTNLNLNTKNLIEKFYRLIPHNEIPSIPYFNSNCVEIPVSLPDDEILVDRLGIHTSTELVGVWAAMMDSIYNRAELFNFIFHPERMVFIAEAIESLIERAKSKGDIWVTSLDAVAAWWLERSTFSFKIKRTCDDRYEITTHCTQNADVLVQHPGGEIETIEPSKKYQFSINSHLRPVIGVASGYRDEDVKILTNEGYVVELNADPAKCSFILDGSLKLNNRQLLEALITHARGPLVKFSRWPSSFRCAIAFSVDVDAITLMDFVRRVGHFFKIPKN